MKKLLLTFVFLAGVLGAWPWTRKVVPAPESPISVDSIEIAPSEHKNLSRVKKDSAVLRDSYGSRKPSVSRGRSKLSRESAYHVNPVDQLKAEERSGFSDSPFAKRAPGRGRGRSALRVEVKPRGNSPRMQSPRSPRAQ